jgi:hypothetical protein
MALKVYKNPFQSKMVIVLLAILAISHIASSNT